jgi:Possible tRNA binding domain
MSSTPPFLRHFLISFSLSLPPSLSNSWLEAYVCDYRKRLVSLMSYSFSSLEAALAITLVDPDRYASLLQPFHYTVRYLPYRTHNKCLLHAFN